MAGIPKREVHDQEEVIIVLVELGAFDGAADVFQVERVEVRVAFAQALDVRGAGVRQVEPGDVAVLDDACGHGGDLTTEGIEGTEGKNLLCPFCVRRRNFFGHKAVFVSAIGLLRCR